MFENIIGQNELTTQLVTDLESSSLPGSLLFEGPAISAKTSCALELARVRSCDGKARWNCPCEQCARHRRLIHPDLIMLGPKNLREEIAIAVNMLQTVPTTASRYFFIRAVRKLTNRFVPDLYQNEEGRLAKAQALIRPIMEGLEQCAPENSDDQVVATEARKLLPACEKLQEMVPASTPVFQVRSVEHMIRLAPWHRHRIVLMEHADKMMESARNAMLKMLEEPPQQTTFILTTTRRGAIIQTILSRLRPYRFLPRNENDTRVVLDRIFRLDQQMDSEQTADTLESYFMRFRSQAKQSVAAYARQFLSSILAELLDRGYHPDAGLKQLSAECRLPAELTLAAMLKESNGLGGSSEAMNWLFPAFLEEVGSLLAGLLKQPGSGLPTLRLAEYWSVLSRDAQLRYSSYNLNAAALSERMLDSLLRMAL
ncbi:MAG: hypothetical protein KKI09_16525 [Spirochaetes bacterium]|nr:hypothetical protein [Spirochaetota bacterium]MBU0957030.1 hypothetical protein [Spirochaetota bacterium]